MLPVEHAITRLHRLGAEQVRLGMRADLDELAGEVRWGAWGGGDAGIRAFSQAGGEERGIYSAGRLQYGLATSTSKRCGQA